MFGRAIDTRLPPLKVDDDVRAKDTEQKEKMKIYANKKHAKPSEL
jgi:hypothetical protein